MDQQLDEYQQRMEKTWAKVKASVLHGLPRKHQSVLVIILLLLVFSFAYGLYLQGSSIVFWLSPQVVEDYSIGWAVPIIGITLLEMTIPALGMVGVVLMLMSKTRGWVFVTALLYYALLWRLGMIIGVFTRPYDELNIPGFDFVTSLVNPSFGVKIFNFLLFVIFLGFMMSKPIKKHYGIGKKQVRWSICIPVFYLLINIVFILTMA